jgi:outer membrane protein TolC
VAATRAQLAQAQARDAGAEGDLDAVREVFRGVVGAEPDQLQPPRTPAGLSGSRDEVIAASADNPALAAAARNVDAARGAVDGARSQLRPSLAAAGSVGVPASSAEVVLTVPLFDGGLAESQSRGAEQELAQRRLELDAQRRMVRQDAVAAWQALASARAGIAAFRTQVESARAARDGLARERAQGLRTQLEVLQAEQQLLDAQLGLADAERDATVAAYRVLAATGRLSAEALGLAVARYDPQGHAADVAGRIWDRHEVGRALLGPPQE